MANPDFAESIFHPDIIVVAEFLTIIACAWLIYEGLKLFNFFVNHRQYLSKLLSLEFLTKVGTAVMTFFMGVFLFFDWGDGVKLIVIIRPIFVAFSAYALHKLYKYYKSKAD